MRHPRMKNPRRGKALVVATSFVSHQEINARSDEPVEAVVVRSGQVPIVVNLDIQSPEAAGSARWIDPDHPA